MEAIQLSWDQEGMIVQEDRGIGLVLEDFALYPCDFALHLQAVQNFISLPRISYLVSDFALLQPGSAKFLHHRPIPMLKWRKIENGKFCVPSFLL